ncbi:unnamed protein product [Paramecium pentaurelia]|uniref:Uncharacterized protein n=1 Tax=Paramecium pentaurelia TaxID=43138 RepID=A0A8S1VVM9_9CILI|nr:unnamed protein product [Paramecium pentaurelia]
MQSNKGHKLDELLTCFICLSNLTNPHICPCCSKLCCYSCITKWLTENRQCPHCRSSLRIQQLVNCRFLEDIVAQNDPCPLHNAQLQYYCVTCAHPICSECAMFSAHKMHEFEHIQKVFDSKIKDVKTKMENVQDKLKTLKHSAIVIDELMDELNRSKDERVQEIQAYTEQLLQKLEQTHTARMGNLQMQRQRLNEKILIASAELDNISQQIKGYQKSKTIMTAQELLQRIEQVNVEPEQIGGVPMNFQSEITPQYVCDSFELNSFNQSDEIVYSDHLITNGIRWRLKIYPHGNGNAKNIYISIFLEMDSKYAEIRRYEYKIEMINQKNGLSVIREFASDFEGGECWGYNRFFRIDLLQKDGYLVNDKLLFKYYVRAPNYYTQCLDMQRYIKQLESQVSIQQTTRKIEQQSSIQKLKEEIEQYAEKIEQLEQSQPSNTSEIQESEEDHQLQLQDQESSSSSNHSDYYFDGQYQEIPIQQESLPIRRNLIQKFNQSSLVNTSQNLRSPLSEFSENLYS